MYLCITTFHIDKITNPVINTNTQPLKIKKSFMNLTNDSKVKSISNQLNQHLNQQLNSPLNPIHLNTTPISPENKPEPYKSKYSIINNIYVQNSDQQDLMYSTNKCSYNINQTINSKIKECNNYNDLIIRSIDHIIYTQNKKSSITKKILSTYNYFKKIALSNQDFGILTREFNNLNTIYSLAMHTFTMQYTSYIATKINLHRYNKKNTHSENKTEQ